MIRSLIVEDEIQVREALKKMLKILTPSIKIIAETGDVKEAIHAIDNLKPELVFLDIELENGSGFDVLQKLNYDTFQIIFTTAYDQYAIKAFKYSSIDYLLKPIDPNELKEAVGRAIVAINKEAKHQELLTILKNNLQKEEQKIVLNTTEQRYILAVKNIIRLEADGAYTLFVTQEQSIIVSKNIKYYQELLNDKIFLRCHQSHIVNRNHIKSLIKGGSLLLSNKDMIPISTRKKNEIIRMIANL